MNATDYRQIYRTVERCNAELQGIAHRLHGHDDEAALVVERMINDLTINAHALAQLWHAQQHSEPEAADEISAADAA